MLEREEQYFHILRSPGHWDKGEDLLTGTLRELGAKPPPDDLRALRAQSNLAIACLDTERLMMQNSCSTKCFRRAKIHSAGGQMKKLVHQSLLASVYTAQEKFVKGYKTPKRDLYAVDWLPPARIISNY